MLGEGIAHGNEGLRVAEDIGHKQWISASRFNLGQTYLYACAYEQAVEQLESALQLGKELGSAWWIGNAASYLAITLVEIGQADRAQAMLDEAWPESKEGESLAVRRMKWARGAIALAQGDAERALSIADGLIATAPGAKSEAPIPLLELMRAQALAQLGRTNDARSAFDRAKSGALDRGATPVQWLASAALAHFYQQTRQAELADNEIREARAIIEELARSLNDESLAAQLHERAGAKLPQARSITPLRAAKEAYGGLTARERDVAALVARGLSNREIAEELVLGERTIETHVGNILSKLDFSSRAQIAVWAVEKGLATSN
jgi:DNA-binding CsgD family transcriptional regulator